ncbi:MAG: phage neck terminator protein [Maricaulaceae bacterium]
MTEFDIYKAVRGWVKTVTGLEAIKSSETAPRPTATTSGSLCAVPETGLYVTMEIAEDVEIRRCGPEIEQITDEEGECFNEVVHCFNAVTINLAAYRCGAYDALRELRASLKAPRAFGEFTGGYLSGFIVREIGALTTTRTPIKTQTEDRAGLTFTLSYCETIRRSVPCIYDMSCDPCFEPQTDDLPDVCS